MIKINLLRTKEEGKKGGIRKDWIIFFFSIALLLILLILVQWRITKEKEETLAQIAAAKKDIAYYKSLTAEVNKAKEAQRTLQDKLNVINTLKKEKKSPVRVLDELSIQKPEKLHIEFLKKDGPKLGIEGIALDDETIANFMTSLRKSKVFKNIDLIVSEQSEQSKLKLKKFTLACEITLI